MKKIVIAALLMSGSAMAKEDWEIELPSLSEQYEQAQKGLLDQMVKEAETDPYFAGTMFTVNWKDDVYKIVDRRSEPRRPGTTPPPRDRFVELTQSLGAGAHGKLRLEVKIDRRADGSETETWIFEVDAGWQAQESMKESMGKYHR